MRPILALGFLLLGASSAVSEPKHPDALVAAASDAPTAADAPLSEPISIDRLIGSVDLKSDVEVPSLEAIEASHERQDSVAEPPPSGEACGARKAQNCAGSCARPFVARVRCLELISKDHPLA